MSQEVQMDGTQREVSFSEGDSADETKYVPKPAPVSGLHRLAAQHAAEQKGKPLGESTWPEPS